MFDAIRHHKKFLMGFLLILIIPGFVLFGIEGYSRFQERGETVATVDGHDIRRPEWDAAHRQEVERLRESMPGVDSKLFDTDAARYATLERMVRERVLAAAATHLKLTTSNQRLAKELAANPTIASLRGADGKIDLEAYRALLGRRGMTPDSFEAGLRADLSRAQVLEAVSASSTATAGVAHWSLNAFYERREVRQLLLPASAYAAKVNPSEADLEAYYKRHTSAFQVPEQADVQYLVLDLPAIEQSIVLNPADVKAYYEQNAARLSGGEERRASHILLAFAEGADAAAKDKVRSEAKALLEQVRKDPSQFAALAKAKSQDPGSAAKGGDLDFFGRGAMVKPFEDAVFAMSKGQISDLVESDFGIHIIQLTDIRAPQQRPFEQMRAELETELKRQQAQKRFAEMADTFADLVFEQANSLQPVADRLKLEIQTANGIGRTPSAQGGVLANARLLEALFSADSIEKKRNTEAIEVGSNQLVAARLVRHTPARTQTLDEVRATVRERFVAERAAQLAREDGEKQLTAARNGTEPNGLGAATVVSREHGGDMPVRVLNAVMATKASTLPAWTGVDLGAQGYALVKIDKVLPRDTPDAQRQKDEVRQYGQLWAQAEVAAYYDALKERYKARILVPAPAAR